MGKYDWMDELKTSSVYKAGVDEFMRYVREINGVSTAIRCPCKNCLNCYMHPQNIVKAHLLVDGIHKGYRPWSSHGEEPGFVPPTSYATTPTPSNATNIEENKVDDSDNDSVADILDDLGVLNDGMSTNHNNDGSFNISSSFLESLINDSKEYLFPGLNKYTKFSFLVKLLHLKVYGMFSKKTLDGLLWLLRDAVPAFNVLPKDTYEACKYLKEMGMGQQKIDVCKYDCTLFWKEHENVVSCTKCGAPRYKFNDGVGKPIPHKVLRYFPLKPRLQRLYLSSKVAPHMVWHKDAIPSDNKWITHPRDSEAWKKFNFDFPSFAADGRNVYLALASDGFNPFGNLSLSYSMWPVILTTYNLPPWMCMKPEYYMMCLLIPGPDAPGMDIDVFLQPLIDELNDLWDNGLRTFDAAKKEWFNMHACLLWTINDFPAYGILSGWQTKGYMACPICKDRTPSKRLRSKIGYIGCRCFLPMNHHWRRSKKFDGKIERRTPPKELSAEQLLKEVESLPHFDHGKHPSNRKRQRDDYVHNWRKKSFFFQLPYWHKLALRHNLDVMHVEKNILENLLWTILDVDGKSKDTIKARLDLEDMHIRKELHLQKQPDGKYSIPKACYALSKSERKEFCEFLKSVKMPDGYASHIGRCVNVEDARITGLKSHDCHVLLQCLLAPALSGLLPKAVVGAISELGTLFNRLCKRKVLVDDIKRMQHEMILLLCKLELIFPPALFDVMIHLAIHLPKEVLLAGPVAYRWMYPIERFLCSLKKFVRNRARPEGSIAEAYVVHECITWCSMHIEDMETRFNRLERNYDVEFDDELFPFRQKVRLLGVANYSPKISEKEIQRANWYILSNTMEVKTFIDEHRRILEEERVLDIEAMQIDSFPHWFKIKMQDIMNEDGKDQDEMTKSLYALSCGHNLCIKSYTGIIVNGVRYHTEACDARRKCQNSSIMVHGEHNGKIIEFYGVIQDILELQFVFGKKIYLLKCKWWDLGSHKNVKIDNNMTSINVYKTWYDDEPFILASQAKQVYYLVDRKNGPWWRVVRRHEHRHIYDVPLQLNTMSGIRDEDAQLKDVLTSSDDEDNEVENIPIQLIDDDFTKLSRVEVEAATIDADVIDGQVRVEIYTSSEEDEDEDDTLIEYIDSDEQVMALGGICVLIIYMAGTFPWKRMKEKGKKKICSSASAPFEESIQEMASIDISDITLTSVHVDERPPPTLDTKSVTERQYEAGPSQIVRRRGKTRGIALEKLNASMGHKITIVIDPYSGRPTDRIQAKHFQTLIGIAAREDAPMEPDFRLIKKEHLRGCYDRIKAHANVVGLDDEPWVYGVINSRLAKQIKENRHYLKKKFDEIGDLAKPPSMPIELWERYKKWWGCSKFIEKSKKNQHTRVNYVKNHHTCGATSFAVIRKEISDNELGGAPCGPILLYHRSHYKSDKNGEGKWGSESAHSTYLRMVDMQEKAMAAGTPIDEEEIVDMVLGNGDRTDWRNGWGYGHKPERTRERRKNVSQADLDAAIRATEDAVREKLTAEMDAKVASINKGWQEKIHQQEETQKLMLKQMEKMKKWIYNIMQTKNHVSNKPLSFNQLNTSSMPSSLRKRKFIIDESDEEEEELYEEDSAYEEIEDDD